MYRFDFPAPLGRWICIVTLTTVVAVGVQSLAGAQNSTAHGLERKVPLMSHHAEGPFDAKTSPLAADDTTTGTKLGRYGLDKQYHGDLEGTAKGEMLAAGNPATGTAGYVAIEEVTGTLQGHKGSFALQHFGVMNQGKVELAVKVVPGSGSGELQGIDGTMTIKIESGRHSYTFDYTLPAAP